MVNIQMTACDNPQCGNVGHPEVESTGKTRARRGVPPYGWIDTDLWVIGAGPCLRVVTCSVACLTPAANHLISEWERKDRGE
jgi:hypothetical protein